MRLPKLLLGFLLTGGTLMAGAATLTHLGAAKPDENLSLRQESSRSPGGFFHNHRSHRGGGLRGGK